MGTQCFSDNGTRIWLFVDLASVADGETGTAVLEMATGRSE